jgi:hypothetical protein
VKKTSLKKFFLLMALWVAVVLVIFAGAALYDRYKTSEFDDTAGPYIMKIVPELSKWDPATTRALMAPEISAKIPEEDFIQAMALFSRLGALQSMGQPKFDTIQEILKTKIGPLTLVRYGLDAKYENGDAVITLTLVERNGSFEIYRFNFSSEILLK